MSLALPLVTPLRFLPLLLGLPVVVGVVLPFMLSSPLGLVALIVTSLLVPSPTLPGDLNLATRLVALFIGLWLLHTVLEKRGTRLVLCHTVKPLLGLVLSAQAHTMLYVPKGFAHGFLTLTDDSEVFLPNVRILCTRLWPGRLVERPDFRHPWPAEVTVISERDANHPNFTG